MYIFNNILFIFQLFISCVLLVAVVCCNGALIPLTTVIDHHGVHTHHTIHAPITAISSAPGSLSITTTGVHPAALIAAPVQVIAAHPVHHTVAAVAAAPGTYVAVNRGTVHTAPREGHTDAAVSVNLEPAPGTV